MENKKLKLKRDQFRRTRGGYSRLYVIICGKCKSQLMVYQKDGAGILKRLYFDRIFSPKFPMGKRILQCDKCGRVIGILMMYKKEKRRSYRIFVGTIYKHLVKENAT